MVKEFGIYTSEKQNIISIILSTTHPESIVGFDLPISNVDNLTNWRVNTLFMSKGCKMISFNQLFLYNSVENPNLFDNY